MVLPEEEKKEEDVSASIRCVAGAAKRCGSSIWEFTFHAAAFFQVVEADIETEARKLMSFSAELVPKDPAYKMPEFLLEFAKKVHEQVDPWVFFQELRASRGSLRSQSA